MKSIHFAASVVVIFCLSVSGGAEEQPFAYEICLSENRIELGTHAALSLVITNTSPEEIVVMSSGAVFKLPERYESIEPKARTNPNTPHAWDVAPGETLFLVDSVPRDVAFTPLLLGRHTGTAAFEVRWGRGRSELVGLFPMFDDPRPASAQSGRAVLRIPVSYEIVPPSERWMPLRQKYTREVVVHDLLQGGKEVVAYRLDPVAAGTAAASEYAVSIGVSPEEYFRPVKSFDESEEKNRLNRAKYDHPAVQEALRFKVYCGHERFNYNSQLAGLKSLWRGEIPWYVPREGNGLSRTLAIVIGVPAARIAYAATVARKDGVEAGRAYLRSLDQRGFSCADQAFYNAVRAEMSREPTPMFFTPELSRQ